MSAEGFAATETAIGGGAASGLATGGIRNEMDSLPASQQARERGTRVTSTRATTSECATTSDECAAQSFARALRAYHGTLSPRWGPTSDQCEIVRARAARLPWNARPPVGLSPTSSGSVPAPSSRPIQERAASCSSPPAQPPRCGAVARSEKINLAVGQKSTSR